MKKDKKTLLRGGTKVASVVLATSLVATLFAGCGNKKALFEGTILEDAAVMYIDENIAKDRSHGVIGASNEGIDTIDGKRVAIVRPITVDNCSFAYHYEDIVTGTLYHVNSSRNPNAESCNNYKPYFVENPIIEPLTGRLTAEEIEKAAQGKYTDQDAIKTIKNIVAAENQAKSLS